MSDNKNNSKNDLENRLADAKATAQNMLNKHKTVVSKENMVEVAKTRSPKDMILWLFAIVALVASTLISQYLPKYWAPANDSMIQLGITAGLIVFAVICLVFTNQGRAFKVLLKDAGIELRRVTWPSKDETFKYTWQVIVVMIIFGVLIWLFDILLNSLFGLILVK